MNEHDIRNIATKMYVFLESSTVKALTVVSLSVIKLSCSLWAGSADEAWFAYLLFLYFMMEI